MIVCDGPMLLKDSNTNFPTGNLYISKNVSIFNL